MQKRIIAYLLVFLLTFSLLPAQAFAEETADLPDDEIQAEEVLDEETLLPDEEALDEEPILPDEEVLDEEPVLPDEELPAEMPEPLEIEVLPEVFLNSKETATAIHVNDELDVAIGAEESAWFSFTAPENKTYIFASFGSADTSCCLYNDQGEQVAENDDASDTPLTDSPNFCLRYNCTADKTYYLMVEEYNHKEASFTVAVYKAVTIDDGGCGEALSYHVNSNVLTIEGSGNMSDYSEPAPWGTGIRFVNLPEGLTSIGAYAFRDCTILRSITIPANVTSIGEGAFSGCTRLTAFTVSEDNTTYKSVDGVLFTKDGETLIAFPAGKTGAYTIPSSVTCIAEGAIDGCNSLTAFTVAEDNEAYTSVDGVLLTKDGKTLIAFPTRKTGAYTIPSTVTSIAKGAFDGCVGLTDVYYNGTINHFQDIGGNTEALRNVTMHFTCGSNVTCTLDRDGLLTITGTGAIDDEAFHYCHNITSVTIPSSVTSIGNRAFYGCDRLTDITVSEDNEAYMSIDGVLFTKNAKTLIVYPMGKIGAYTIPSSVTSIRDYAFSLCYSLSSVTIPASVTSIGDRAFYACRTLTGATIPAGVTSIGEGTFFGCYELSSVTIPASVTSIGDCAFSYCNMLMDVYYDGTANQFNRIRIGSDNDPLLNATKHIIVTAPKAPKLSSAANGPSYIKLTWTKISNATGYQVYRSTDNGKNYTKIATVKGTETYSDTGVTNGATYQYKVRAYRTDDGKNTFGAYSNIVKAVFVSRTAVSAITNYTSGIKVTWKAVAGATGYQVYRSVDGGSYTKVKTTSATYYTDTDAANGAKVSYKVRAYTKVDGANYFAAFSPVKTSVRLTTPAAATLTKASSTSIKASWAMNKKATGYQIRYSTSSSFPDSSATKTVTVTSYKTYVKTLTGLTSGKTYYVSVRSYKTVDNTNYYSAWSSAAKLKLS